MWKYPADLNKYVGYLVYFPPILGPIIRVVQQNRLRPAFLLAILTEKKETKIINRN